MFAGPPKDVVYTMARGVATRVMEIETLQLGKHESMKELVRLAASVVAEQKMGFVRRNQYLAAIEAHLVTMGMSRSDAGHVKRLIEIRCA
jgi:hypothetical protein